MRPLRYQAPQQRGAAMGDRPSVEEAGGKAAEEAHHLVRRLVVSSGELGPTASGDSQGRELFPRVGFIVTNMSAGPEGVVHFYNGRGTAEQWIKEGKYALNWTRLSCHRFVANQVRLALFILAYNLGNLLRRLCLPRAVKHWSLRSLQVKLIKIRGEASSPRPAAGVSASRGSSASGGISTSAGAHRRAPSSTRVASILGIIGCDEDSQGGAVRLDELKRVQTC